MATLLPQLKPVWNIPKAQCDSVGGTWDRYVQKLPADTELGAIAKTVELMPLLAALGATAIVLLPRIAFTLNFIRTRKAQPGFDPFAQQPDAPRAPAEAPAAPPPPASDEKTMTGGGYDGERRGEYASIDGSEARANE